MLVASCAERTYGFDANGRRTSLAATSYATGDCTGTGTTTTTATSGWDTADRATTGRGGTGTYVYDLFGRQTALPAVDAPNPAAGNITFGYYDDDLPRTIAQGGTTTTFTLDAAGRRSEQATTTTAGPTPGTTTTVRRYTDDGDNPAWVETTPPGPGTTTVTRFEESIGGDLSATIDEAGTATLSLADPHGDAVTTITIPAAQSTDASAVSVNGWASYDEYGTPVATGSGTVDQVDGPLGYGWLGAKQRSTTGDTAGLTLMGVRLYNPTRGQFTSTDPVPGGSASAYAYPFDPVNQFDLNGKWWGSDAWNWAKKKAKNCMSGGFVSCTRKVARNAAPVLGWVGTMAGYCPLTYCQAVSLSAGLLSAGAYAWSGNRAAARKQLVGVAYSVLTGGRGTWFKSAGRASRLINGKGGLAGLYARASRKRHGLSQGQAARREWFAATVMSHPWNMLTEF